MAPKSKATTSKKAPSSAGKPSSKPKAAAPAKSSLSAIADTVTETLDHAGDLLLDNASSSGAKTPVGVTEVLEDAGVPVKKGKKAAGEAVKKGSKVASQKAAEAEEAVKPNSKKRKQAEDFFSSTGEQVLGAVSDLAGKAGHAVEGVVGGFAEASGLNQTGVKEPLKKKAKQVAEQAEQAIEVGKKKGKKAVEDAEEAVEGGKKVAAKKGKQVTEQAEEAVEGGKKAASKKGKQVAEQAEETVEAGKKAAGKKGKQVAEVVVDKAVDAKSASKKGKKAVDEVAVQAEKKGKKASKEAEGVVAQASRTARSTAATAAETAEPVITKGKRAAAAVATEAVKTGKKAGKVAKAAVEAAVEAANEDVDMDGEDEAVLHGFSSSDGEGADSSDDESDDEDEAVRAAGKKVDMKSLPMVAKDDKSVAARLKKAHKKKDTQKGTLYLGRIPHGFYEDQMREYFSQFGDVSRLRLARNRKTGASKHYAYIEMSSEAVAEIVAETMNNYLLMGHLLKCHVIPADEVHPQLWVGANKKFRVIPKARLEKAKHDKSRTQEQQDKANAKLLDKQDKRRQRIKDKGIDYDFDGHA